MGKHKDKGATPRWIACGPIVEYLKKQGYSKVPAQCAYFAVIGAIRDLMAQGYTLDLPRFGVFALTRARDQVSTIIRFKAAKAFKLQMKNVLPIPPSKKGAPTRVEQERRKAASLPPVTAPSEVLPGPTTR